MAKLWKQRPYWPPDGSLVAVIILSALLAAWPFFDSQWRFRAWYTLIVIALLVVASLISARDRWRVEQRYVLDFGAHLMSVRSRIFALDKNLTDIALKIGAAQQEPGSSFSVEYAFFGCSDQVASVISELAHLDIAVPASLMASLDNRPKALNDLKSLLVDLMEMNTRVSELYDKTILGD